MDKCEGLAPFHCGNSDCPVHGTDVVLTGQVPVEPESSD